MSYTDGKGTQRFKQPKDAQIIFDWCRLAFSHSNSKIHFTSQIIYFIHRKFQFVLTDEHLSSTRSTRICPNAKLSRDPQFLFIAFMKAIKIDFRLRLIAPICLSNEIPLSTNAHNYNNLSK